MPVPSVQIKKQSFGAGGGSAGQSAIGIAAIIAGSVTGTQNQPSAYYTDSTAYSVYGDGPLVQYASVDVQESENAVVLCRGTTATAGAYLLTTWTANGSTSTVAASGSVLPADKFSNCLVSFVTGGTVGTAGIQFTYSLDGISTTAIQNLGTANVIVLPNGAGALTLGAGTIVAGASYAFSTERPLMANTDLSASFTALQQTRLPWEGVLIDCAYAAGTVSAIDTWLAGLEAVGQFHFAMINTRMKTRPTPTGETEAAYLTAMQTLTQNDASDRVCVGCDGVSYTSTMNGWSQERATAMMLMARAMSVAPGVMPSYVAIGNAPCSLADGNGNPFHHDEDLFPGLDALRLSTMRSFANPGPQGAYFTNALILSVQPGSSYVYLPHLRTMNLACSIAWSALVGQLGKGVHKLPPDKVTGLIYIDPGDAQFFDGIVNVPLQSALQGQVQAVQFFCSTTDDLSSNTSSKITGTLELESLAYAEQFFVTSVFVKSIAVPLP